MSVKLDKRIEDLLKQKTKLDEELKNKEQELKEKKDKIDQEIAAIKQKEFDKVVKNLVSLWEEVREVLHKKQKEVALDEDFKNDRGNVTILLKDWEEGEYHYKIKFMVVDGQVLIIPGYYTDNYGEKVELHLVEIVSDIKEVVQKYGLTVGQVNKMIYNLNKFTAVNFDLKDAS